MSETKISFDIPGIMGCQMNRYPMLFIDHVTECIPGKYARGYKLFSYNEWFFHGYDTEEPKVWNAIQVEAMSQMFLMTFLSKDELRGSVAMSSKFDKVQFLRKIQPGDRLDIEAALSAFGRGVARGSVRGYVGGKIACSMECTIIVPSVFGGIQPMRIQEAQISTEKSSPAFHKEPVLGIMGIRKFLLNKYPWLFLDAVLEIDPGRYVRAIKNFTYNEHFFPTHFPGAPSVPGFIQIETCMQAFLLTFLCLPQYARRETADRSLNNVQLKRMIAPGDCLEIEASLERFSRGVGKGSVSSTVNGEAAISFEVVVAIADELDKFKPTLEDK